MSDAVHDPTGIRSSLHFLRAIPMPAINNKQGMSNVHLCGE